MAIWNDVYIHGVLDVNDGYYISPFHYNAISYDSDTNTTIYGSDGSNSTIVGKSIVTNSASDTIFNSKRDIILNSINDVILNSDNDISLNSANSIILNGAITINSELTVNNNINANSYSVYMPRTSTNEATYTKFISTDTSNTTYGRCLYIGNSSDVDTVYIQGGYNTSNGQLFLNGGYKGVRVLGDLYLIGSHKLAYTDGYDTYHDIATISGDTLLLGDGYGEELTTHIRGANIIIDAQDTETRQFGTIKTNGTLIVNESCKISGDHNEVLNLSSSNYNGSSEYDITFSDASTGGNTTNIINTKINGDRIIFDDKCYGTNEPPTNGKEGQIYFKIIS